jgi:hypothetical protein
MAEDAVGVERGTFDPVFSRRLVYRASCPTILLIYANHGHSGLRPVNQQKGKF